MVTAAVVISEDRAWTRHLTLAAKQAGFISVSPGQLAPGQPFVVFAAGASLRRLGREITDAGPDGLPAAARGICVVAPVPLAGDQPPWPVPIHVMVPPRDLSWWQTRLGQGAVSLAPTSLLPATAETALWARGQMAWCLTDWLEKGIWPTLVTDAAGFAQAFALRQQVFVTEQAVPIGEELDAVDAVCQHLLLRVDGQVVGTGRLVRPERANDPWHLGRIAVHAAWRGQGLGQAVVTGLEQLALAQAPVGRPIEAELSAQIQAAGFYERLGYQLYGPTYLDAGIVHRDARRVIRP